MTALNRACVLLDLDGTLANSLAVMWQAYQSFLATYDIAATQQEFAEFNGPPLSSVVHQLQARYRLPGHAAQLLQHYETLIDTLYQQVTPNPTALDLLITLKQQHYQIGVITSNQQIRTSRWLAHTGLQGYIDFVVSGEDVQHGKPDPEPYLLGLQLARCDAEDAIAIEDSPQGMQAAVAAGLRTFWLQHQPQDIAPLNSQPIQQLIEVLDFLPATR